MSSTHEKQQDRPERQGAAMPLLRSWWIELPLSAKILVPMTGAILVFVTANVLTLPVPV